MRRQCRLQLVACQRSLSYFHHLIIIIICKRIQELCKVVIVMLCQIDNPPTQGAAPTSILFADTSISAEAHLRIRELNVHPLCISSEEWQDDDSEDDEDRGTVSNQQPNLQCYNELL